MGAKTGNISAPVERQAALRRQENVLNQAGKASMFPDRGPGSAFPQRQAKAPVPREGIEFGPGRSRRF
jgi:hypothetical protein